MYQNYIEEIIVQQSSNSLRNTEVREDHVSLICHVFMLKLAIKLFLVNNLHGFVKLLTWLHLMIIDFSAI